MKAQVLKQMVGLMIARKSGLIVSFLGGAGTGLLLATPSLAQGQLAEAKPGMSVVMALPVQLIQENLQSQDLRDRLRAAIALEKVGESAHAAVPQLVQLLNEQSMPEFVAAGVRGAAALALGNMGRSGEVAIPELVGLLSDRQPEVRRAAVTALAKQGAAVRGTMPRLVALLKAENPGVQASTAEVLGNLGAAGESALPDLLQVMKSGNSEAVSSAAVAIGKMGSVAEDAAPVLVEVLLDERSTTKTKGDAATALGNLGEPGKVAIPYLRTATRNLDSNLRERATQALAKLR
jgi:HEAT repeat protein